MQTHKAIIMIATKKMAEMQCRLGSRKAPLMLARKKLAEMESSQMEEVAKWMELLASSDAAEAVAVQREQPPRLSAPRLSEEEEWLEVLQCAMGAARCEELAEATRACPICCEQAVLMSPEEYSGPYMQACSHEACEACWRQWTEQLQPKLRREMQVRATCLACPKTLPQRMVLQISEPMRQLSAHIELRAKLQASELYPPAMQVECRKAECVGIGYLGYETVMCFICQEQWSVADGEEVPLEHGCAEVKACPKCGVLIDKAGGCDHMTCRMCKWEWYWSTGKPYRVG